MHKRIFKTNVPNVVKDAIKAVNANVIFRPVRTGVPDAYVIEGDVKYTKLINKIVDLFDMEDE